MDPNTRQQALEQLKSAGTVLVTTVSNPTTDQLAATLGLSQMLKKLGKNVSTIVTSSIPENLHFLHPDKQFTDSLDSLRDFIVSLDKNLADKLRYKVEGDEVRIFITPYHTKIGKDDVRFSQGDFNVDAVVIIGAKDRTDIDAAIMKESRVLNETPVIVVNAGNANATNIGGISWADPQASSVSEMMVSASEALQGGILDEQISTTLLTGIIAATNHFSNPDTSPKVMTMAAQLMASGANQQSIMEELKSFDPQSPKDSPIATQKMDIDSDNSVNTTSTKAVAGAKESAKDDNQKPDEFDMKIKHDDEKSPQNLDSKLPDSSMKTEKPKLPATQAVEDDTFASIIDSKLKASPIEPPKVVPSPIVENPKPKDKEKESAPSPAVNSLDEARAAVQAAVSNQPTGTAFNPTEDMGALPLTTNTPAIQPNVASLPPQLVPAPPMPATPAISNGFDAPAVPKFPPNAPGVAAQDNSSIVSGSASPSQLYPTVDAPYDPSA